MDEPSSPPPDPYSESELLKHFDTPTPVLDTLKKIAKIGTTTFELLHQLFKLLQ